MRCELSRNPALYLHSSLAALSHILIAGLSSSPPSLPYLYTAALRRVSICWFFFSTFQIAKSSRVRRRRSCSSPSWLLLGLVLATLPQLLSGIKLLDDIIHFKENLLNGIGGDEGCMYFSLGVAQDSCLSGMFAGKYCRRGCIVLVPLLPLRGLESGLVDESIHVKLFM